MKLIAWVFFLSSSLFAATLPDFIGADNSQPSGLQRSIKTVEDYKEIEGALKNAIAVGDVSKAIPLGALYEQSWTTTQGKTIAANKDKAIASYKIAANKGLPLACFKVGINSLEKNKIDDALGYFEKGAKYKKDKASIACASAYAATVLQLKRGSMPHQLKAISIIRPVVDTTNLPTPQFLIAHLYNVIGEEKSANQYLTKTCTNPMADKAIKDFCYSGDLDVFYKGQKLEAPKTSGSSCSK